MKPYNIIIILISYVFCGYISCSADRSPESVQRALSPKELQINELIKQLGNENWQIRENASKSLEDIGESAEPFLKEALLSSDAEIANRANIILGVIKKRLKFSDALLKEFPDFYRDLLIKDKFAMLQEITADNGHKYNVTNDDIANLIGEIILTEYKNLSPSQKLIILAISNGENYHVGFGIDIGGGYYKPVPQTAPYIIKLLNDKSKIVRAEAVNTLCRFGTREAIPEIIVRLNDEDKTVRMEAVLFLGSFRVKEAIPKLMQLLNDEDEGVRQSAIAVLSQFGVKEAIPGIIKLLKDKNKYVQYNAIHALIRLDAKEALPDIMNLLNHEDKMIYVGVIFACYKFGGAKDMVPEITKLMHDEDKSIRGLCLLLLNSITIKELIPEIITLLKDEDSSIRQKTASVLGQYDAKEAINEIMLLLNDKEGRVRGAAAISLIELGAKDLIPKGKSIAEDIKLLIGWYKYDSKNRALEALKVLEVDDKSDKPKEDKSKEPDNGEKSNK